MHGIEAVDASVFTGLRRLNQHMLTLQVHSELSGDIVVEDVARGADDGSGGSQVRALPAIR